MHQRLNETPECIWLLRSELSTSDSSFRVREDYPRELADSIARRGVSSPLFVREDPTAAGVFHLLSGWGRYRLAPPTQERLPCFVLRGAATREELWDLFLEDNERWGVIEIARVIRQLLSDAQLDAERIITEKLRLLGLRRSKELYQSHLKLLDLPVEVQAYVEERGLSLRRARSFFRLPAGAAHGFISAARRYGWTLNEVAEAAELLDEIAHSESVSPEAVLAAACRADDCGGDSPEAGNAVLAALRERRYPELTRYRGRLAELSAGLRFDVPVRVEWDPTLERPGVRLIADLEDADSMSRFREELARNEEFFKGFYDLL